MSKKGALKGTTLFLLGAAVLSIVVAFLISRYEIVPTVFAQVVTQGFFWEVALYLGMVAMMLLFMLMVLEPIGNPLHNK